MNVMNEAEETFKEITSLFSLEFSLQSIIILWFFVWLLLMVPSIIALIGRNNIQSVLSKNIFVSVITFIAPFGLGLFLYLYTAPSLYKEALYTETE